MFDYIKITLLALITSLTIASSSLALTHNGIVHDEDGGCVRTNATDGKVTPCVDIFSLKKIEERTIYFDLNKTEIKASQLLKIAKLAETLTFNKIGKVKIVGYTDATGSSALNTKLSKARSEEVKKQLSKLVTLDSIVEIKSMGDTDFAQNCNNKKGSDLEKCRDLNRRVVVELQEVVVNNN